MSSLIDLVNNDSYKYTSLACATTFLLPQIWYGLRTKCLKDVSTLSLLMIFLGGLLWSIYLYENEMWAALAPTLFLCSNAAMLVIMSYAYYFQRVNDHWKSFDQPLQPIVPATKTPPTEV